MPACTTDARLAGSVCPAPHLLAPKDPCPWATQGTTSLSPPVARSGWRTKASCLHVFWDNAEILGDGSQFPLRKLSQGGCELLATILLIPWKALKNPAKQRRVRYNRKSLQASVGTLGPAASKTCYSQTIPVTWVNAFLFLLGRSNWVSVILIANSPDGCTCSQLHHA